MPHDVVRSPDHTRDRSLGWLAVAWIEHFCVHGPGDIKGTPLDSNLPDSIPLSDELTSYTLDCYALDERGRRLYDRTFYSRPKGCDKSGQGARIALFEAMGPCRFAGWAKGGETYRMGDFVYVYEPGEAMGRPITSPYIRVMATEEGQTGNVYDTIYMNFREWRLREFLGHADDAGLTRIMLDGQDLIVPSTASSAAKDGGKETHAVIDEPHLYTTPELHRMYDTVKRNLTKRAMLAEPWLGEYTTMYEPGRDSVAEETHKLAKAIQKGQAKRARLLFDHRYGEYDDIHDDEKASAALNDAYGDATSYISVERLLNERDDPSVDEPDWRRYYLNQASQSLVRAFNSAAWQKYSTAHAGEPGAFISLGFDGSRFRDCTALIATDIPTGDQWPIGIWTPSPGQPIASADVDAAVNAAFSTYVVWKMYGDPNEWFTEMAEWAGRFRTADGKDRVVQFPTTMRSRAALTFRAYAAAIESGDTKHTDDPEFARHIANAIRRVYKNMRDENGISLWLPEKSDSQSPDKIDAAYAGGLSYQARLDAVAAGATPPKGKSPPSIYIPDDD